MVAWRHVLMAATVPEDAPLRGLQMARAEQRLFPV